jgi:signal transduction histidine kinase
MGDFSAWFDTTGFMPHGHCYLWTPVLLWTNVLSDSLIAVSYFAIAVALWVFVGRRRDLPFRPIFVLFGTFVMACGTTHVFDIITIWQPDYWSAALAKVVTALASLGTAILVWPLLPRALALPSPEALREQNRQLQAEVTRRREAEEELRAANLALYARTGELEAANRELEAFSAAASHDLRAPLRHIDGYARMLMADAPGLSTEHAGLLNSITLAARKMESLIEALLALSRNSAAKPLGENVDMNLLVEEARFAQDAARPQPASPPGSTAIDWQIGPLPSVRGNRALLLIALNNLLSNAVKFSSKRARPMIRVEVHDTSAERIEISISDNGAGFDPAYQDKLFGVFQRLHSQSEFDGTGIGLATVRRIIERHGGRIRASGRPGEGAVFTFSLPRA